MGGPTTREWRLNTVSQRVGKSVPSPIAATQLCTNWSAVSSTAPISSPWRPGQNGLRNVRTCIDLDQAGCRLRPVEHRGADGESEVDRIGQRPGYHVSLALPSILGFTNDVSDVLDV